ncbi:AMP-binding protein [Sinomonas susongensis]|uniref:AMP-binding protein n=1 Tax=Sinomonas susongensis TaxID=1324851 RepID=UPI0011087BA5|nr:AMP-binding protein [Sinomonas susongensis]
MSLDPALKALAAALASEGPAIEFGPGGSRSGAWRPWRPTAAANSLPAGTAVVVRTSGSTGSPKATALTVDALAASSMSTAFALHGEGQWLLALPLEYVAGVQVLVRSLFAGTRPVEMDLSDGFTPEAFEAAAAELTDPIRFTSLVPTQLRRLLEDPSLRLAQLLRRFNAVLIGGAPIPPGLLERAAEAGVRVVTTYGSAETCGGCVYNGFPIEGVSVRIAEDGRIRLGGPVVAAGYVGDPELTAAHFVVEDGEPWFVTSDLGELTADGQLRVLGRVDDVVITGGVKASAARVAAELEAVDGVREAFVAGVRDAEWGQALAAAVVLEGVAPGTPPAGRDLALGIVRAAAVERLGRLAPKTWLVLDELPLLPNGKPDRQALVLVLARAHVARPPV